MVKRVFILAALMFTLFVSVGECSHAGITKILIEDQTRHYITTFAMEHYSETQNGDVAYTKGRIIFDSNGVWRSFYAVINTEKQELLRLEIDNVLLYAK